MKERILPILDIDIKHFTSVIYEFGSCSLLVLLRRKKIIGIIPGFVVRGDRQRIGWQGLPETGSHPTGGRSGFRDAAETLPASC
jgi:hypothetical protein